MTRHSKALAVWVDPRLLLTARQNWRPPQLSTIAPCHTRTERTTRQRISGALVTASFVRAITGCVPYRGVTSRGFLVVVDEVGAIVGDQ